MTWWLFYKKSDGSGSELTLNTVSFRMGSGSSKSKFWKAPSKNSLALSMVRCVLVDLNWKSIYEKVIEKIELSRKKGGIKNVEIERRFVAWLTTTSFGSNLSKSVGNLALNLWPSCFISSLPDWTSKWSSSWVKLGCQSKIINHKKWIREI